ncbi:Putative hydrolase [Minicystis rosea]|nr:Putative hydrolase [Minicystis rosea]
MMSSSGFQRVNGLRLCVHRHRDPDAVPSGLTIVLLHGVLDAGVTWDMVAPTLARAGHDVVAPDLRGFGQSDHIGAGGYYHFPDYVADVAELVDALAPRRLAIVGHSMGGTVAALYAGAHPDRVERLALLEGLGPMATEPNVAVDRMQAWLRTLREVPRTPKVLSSLQEAVERLCLHHPRIPRDIIESRAKLLTRTDDTGRLIWAYDPLHRTTSPTPFSLDSFKEFLRRIDCPTLVVGGGPVGWHPPDEAQRIACLKQATTVEIPTAGHMMHWTEPHALAHHLARFFGEPPPAKTRPPVSSAGHPSAAQPSGAPSAAHASAPRSSSEVPTAATGHAPPPASPAGVTPPGQPSVSWSGAAAAPAPPAAPGVTAAGIGGVTPGKPIYGGAAADLGAPAPAAGAVPVGPTRPSTGVPPHGSEGSGGSG